MSRQVPMSVYRGGIVNSAVWLMLACTSAEARLAAVGTGDVADEPAERRSPTQDLRVQCGQGVLTSAGEVEIERMPYVQRVESTSAVVMFTTRGAASPPSLELARPGGAIVERLAPQHDPADSTGRQWAVRLSSLDADATYCYSLEGWSEPSGFRTAPLAGVGTKVSFVAFGDSGGGEDTRALVRDQLETVAFDLILHTGDIAYGSGTLSQLENRFFASYSDLLGSIPVFPTTGNHDYETNGAAPYRQVFALPENGSPEGLERWYSFDWGDVHFVALDTERLNAAQTLWLERDLSENELPWTIAYMHRPPYSSGTHGGSQSVRDTLVPAFEAHGVQVVLSGHDHDYERTHPINGVTYVVTGGGGHGTRTVGRSSFTAFSEAVLHFVYGEVDGEYLVLHAIDAAGREFDSVRIARDGGRGPTGTR